MFKLSCLRRNLFLPASFSARTPVPQTPARQGQMFQKNHKLFVYCAGSLPLPLPPASGHVFRWLRSQGLKILLEFSGLFYCSVVKVLLTFCASACYIIPRLVLFVNSFFTFFSKKLLFIVTSKNVTEKEGFEPSRRVNDLHP